MQDSGGLGRPLRVPVFRNLLIADLVSDIGTFMQNVGAAWLMLSLHAGAWSAARVISRDVNCRRTSNKRRCGDRRNVVE